MKEPSWKKICRICLALTVAAAAVGPESLASALDGPDPLLDLFIRKGFVTQEEAQNVKAEADALRTNAAPSLGTTSKWKLSDGLKSVELFGDLRLRYEGRSVEDLKGGKIDLSRWRASARVGLRGEVFENFYYGFRLDTAANPRSAWVTLGSSSSGTPYQGPFGKSTDTINIGLVNLGWRPTSWLDITLGKMSQPLYTTAMVWDTDINPEGAAERFKHTVGEVDFFANFGQFLYQDENPNNASGGLGFNGLTGQGTDNIFQFAYQGGFNYHITTNMSAKVAATLYQYVGMQRSTAQQPNANSPYFGDPFVGEGAYLGPGTGTTYGSSGYGTSGSLAGYGSLGYPNNQVGLNDLLVLELPFEFNFKINKLDARVFGDFAYNLEGGQRAEAAAAAYKVYLANQSTAATIAGFAPQKSDVKAYQIGFALASEGNLGQGRASGSKKHAWEARAYWQHVEQYALDPNLLDSDFFEGRGNLEGLYASLAYNIYENVVGTFRYGYANRINKNLGTGGSNQDIPQMNPIEHYNILQLDLTLKF